MNLTDPVYLRTIYDGLLSGNFHKENASSLPFGIIGIYEDAIPSANHLNERQKFLEFFSTWALIRKEVSIEFVTALLDWPEEQALFYIAQYSKWFNAPVSGKYLLYHERLRSFVLQKISQTHLLKLNEAIIRMGQDALKLRQGDEWEQYSLEYLSSHLLIQAMHSGMVDALKELSFNINHWNRQLEISKGFEWSKRMLNDMMLWALKFNDDEVIECALKKIELYQKEQNDAPRILNLVAQNDIDTALQCIESFGGNDKEGLQRKFILYMLCLIDLIENNSSDKHLKREMFRKLIIHLDENLKVDHFVLNWDQFFPSKKMFLIAAKLAELNLDFKILFKYSKNWRYNWLSQINKCDKSIMKVLTETVEIILDLRDDNYSRSRELMELAEECINKKKFKYAYKLIDKAIIIARIIDDEELRRSVLLDISVILGNGGKRYEAEILRCEVTGDDINPENYEEFPRINIEDNLWLLDFEGGWFGSSHHDQINEKFEDKTILEEGDSFEIKLKNDFEINKPTNDLFYCDFISELLHDLILSPKFPDIIIKEFTANVIFELIKNKGIEIINKINLGAFVNSRLNGLKYEIFELVIIELIDINLIEEALYLIKYYIYKIDNSILNKLVKSNRLDEALKLARENHDSIMNIIFALIEIDNYQAAIKVSDFFETTYDKILSRLKISEKLYYAGKYIESNDLCLAIYNSFPELILEDKYFLKNIRTELIKNLIMNEKFELAIVIVNNIDPIQNKHQLIDAYSVIITEYAFKGDIEKALLYAQKIDDDMSKSIILREVVKIISKSEQYKLGLTICDQIKRMEDRNDALGCAGINAAIKGDYANTFDLFSRISETDELNKYKAQLAYVLLSYKGEQEIKDVFGKYKEQLTNSDFFNSWAENLQFSAIQENVKYYLLFFEKFGNVGKKAFEIIITKFLINNLFKDQKFFLKKKKYVNKLDIQWALDFKIFINSLNSNP